MRMSSNHHTEKWGRSTKKGTSKKKEEKDKSINGRRKSSTSWKKKIES